MIIYEDYHFGDPQEISLYHIREFSSFAHLHRSYELLRLKRGKLMATVDGRDFPMEPGDLILILPYEIHSYANLGGAECQVNVFSPDYIEEFHKMTARKAPSSDLLHQILIYVQEHYLEELTLQDLAVHLGYNRMYISRFINSHLNLSFTDLVNQHRINFGAHLLKTTDAPVSDIAFACGYNSLRSFNRCFKEIQHMTPREYRGR